LAVPPDIPLPQLPCQILVAMGVIFVTSLFGGCYNGDKFEQCKVLMRQGLFLGEIFLLLQKILPGCWQQMQAAERCNAHSWCSGEGP